MYKLIDKIFVYIKKYLRKEDNIEVDQAYFYAENFIKGKSTITYNQLQKGLNIGYARTAHIMELLEKNNKIYPKENGREKRKIKT